MPLMQLERLCSCRGPSLLPQSSLEIIRSKILGLEIVSTDSFILGSAVTVHLAGVRTSDVLYNALPLYHSSAGMLAIGPAILYSVTVALRKKFSASHFWKDCCRYDVTVRHILSHLSWLSCRCPSSSSLTWPLRPCQRLVRHREPLIVLWRTFLIRPYLSVF